MNELNKLSDGHLELIPATKEMIQYELEKSLKVFECLNVAVPPCWPPELNDDDSFRHFLSLLETVPEAQNWGACYAVLTSRQGRKLVGNGGFHAPPNDAGAVEIGYSILAPYQCQGYATALTRILLKYAFADPRVRYVHASTYPHLKASIRVLEKAGFSFHENLAEGVISYRLYA